MKMTNLEKRFVNDARHGARTSRRAEELLGRVELHPGQRYLDVGCGNGAAAIRIAQRYPLDVTGMDVDPGQIRLAERASAGLQRVRFLVGDAAHLPAEDGEFDIVSMLHMTHHMRDWEEAVREALRVLRPRGWLLFADFQVPAWLARVATRLHGGSYPNRAALRRIAERGGLEEVWSYEGLLHCERVYRRAEARASMRA